MKWIVKYVLILGFFFFTACSPVMYEASHPHHRDHHHHVVKKNVYHYPPIEISFFADTSYMGTNFIPFTFVIADGGFKKISFYRGNGKHLSFYAHYTLGSVHFDSDLNCKGQQPSHSFKFNQMWAHGQTYQIRRLGKKYPLRGVNLKIQEFAKVEKKHESNRKTSINFNRHEKFDSPIRKGFARNEKAENDKIVATKSNAEKNAILTVKKIKNIEQSKVINERLKRDDQNPINRTSLSKGSPQKLTHENARENSDVKKGGPKRAKKKEPVITNVSHTNKKNVIKTTLMNSKMEYNVVKTQQLKEKGDKKKNKSKLQ